MTNHPCLPSHYNLLVGGPCDGRRMGRALAAPLPGCRFGVFSHRRADLQQISPAIRVGRVVASRSCQGVWLAEVLEFRQSLWGQTAYHKRLSLR